MKGPHRGYQTDNAALRARLPRHLLHPCDRSDGFHEKGRKKRTTRPRPQNARGKNASDPSEWAPRRVASKPWSPARDGTYRDSPGAASIAIADSWTRQISEFC